MRSIPEESARYFRPRPLKSELPPSLNYVIRSTPSGRHNSPAPTTMRPCDMCAQRRPAPDTRLSFFSILMPEPGASRPHYPSTYRDKPRIFREARQTRLMVTFLIHNNSTSMPSHYPLVPALSYSYPARTRPAHLLCHCPFADAHAHTQANRSDDIKPNTIHPVCFVV